MEKYLEPIKKIFLSAIILVIPLFFLPITQEFPVTNKFYLLALAIIILTVIYALQLVDKKKFTILRTPFDLSLTLLVVAVALSTLVSAPNHVQSALSLPTGLAPILVLAIFTALASRILRQSDWEKLINKLLIVAAIGAIIAVVLYFNPFKNVPLPYFFIFLKSPGFNTVGSQLDFLLTLGFFSILGVSKLLVEKVTIKLPPSGTNKIIQIASIDDKKHNKAVLPLPQLVSIITVILVFLFYMALFVRKDPTVSAKLPPMTISWYAAVETLKNPKTALFGVAADNFIVMFDRVKPASYNLTDLWTVGFNKAGSFILNLWTETGVLGLTAYLILIVTLLRQMMASANKKTVKMVLPGTIYLLTTMSLLPPSFMIIFLFFMIIALVASEKAREYKSFDWTDKLAAYLSGALALLLITVGSFYLMARSYTSEFYLKQAADSYISGNGLETYNKISRAIETNPYNEDYHHAFAQLNLFFAGNIARKKKLTDSDRQLISQTVQTAINEEKKAVSLNPQKASHWLDLGIVYRNIINIVKGADSWTVASYQRAILSDPNNPTLRFDLGAIYYGLQNFDQASRLFESAISLKQDWANAYYNLAWANFNNKKYPEAVANMQNVLALTDPKNPDFQKAQKELKEFSNKIPKAVGAGESSLQPGSQEQAPLALPTPATVVITPKIELPAGASPEAQIQATAEAQ